MYDDQLDPQVAILDELSRRLEMARAQYRVLKEQVEELCAEGQARRRRREAERKRG